MCLGKLTWSLAVLLRMCSSVVWQQNMQQPKSVKLTKLLSPENIAGLLSDEKAVEALIAHLPEGAQNAYELQATVRRSREKWTDDDVVVAAAVIGLVAAPAAARYSPNFVCRVCASSCIRHSSARVWRRS